MSGIFSNAHVAQMNIMNALITCVYGIVSSFVVVVRISEIVATLGNVSKALDPTLVQPGSAAFILGRRYLITIYLSSHMFTCIWTIPSLSYIKRWQLRGINRCHMRSNADRTYVHGDGVMLRSLICAWHICRHNDETRTAGPGAFSHGLSD